MKDFLYNMFYFLVPVLTIGIPVALSILIYRKLKGKKTKKIWLILALIPVLLAILLFLIPVNL
jgi:hypothetical protein